VRLSIFWMIEFSTVLDDSIDRLVTYSKIRKFERG